MRGVHVIPVGGVMYRLWPYSKVEREIEGVRAAMFFFFPFAAPGGAAYHQRASCHLTTRFSGQESAKPSLINILPSWQTDFIPPILLGVPFYFAWKKPPESVLCA